MDKQKNMIARIVLIVLLPLSSIYGYVFPGDDYDDYINCVTPNELDYSLWNKRERDDFVIYCDDYIFERHKTDIDMVESIDYWKCKITLYNGEVYILKRKNMQD